MPEPEKNTARKGNYRLIHIPFEHRHSPHKILAMWTQSYTVRIIYQDQVGYSTGIPIQGNQYKVGLMSIK